MRRSRRLALARCAAWAVLAGSMPAQALPAGMRLATEPAPSAALATPAEDRRPPDQTFLTFPEWFLVHSPAEYARYLASGAPPDAFPLFAHIGQFWQGYAAVDREVRGRFPFNGGYQLMICVIGASTTVEYAVKGVYEHTIGRLAEATRSGAEPVPEERFAADYAQRYVDFIRVDPWYRFDFGRELSALWQDAPTSGPDLVRRWERRFLLTTELLVKKGYARAIELATNDLYEAPRPVTAVVLGAMPRADAAGHPAFTVLQASDAEVLATVPRYEAFTDYARWLAGQGLDFREIAGNDGEIVVSVLAPDGWQPGALARTLFEQSVITQPGSRRVVMALPVSRLGALLRDVDAQATLRVEHVYDF